LCGNRYKVRAIFELSGILLLQTQICLMNQGCALQGVTETLIAKINDEQSCGSSSYTSGRTEDKPADSPDDSLTNSSLTGWELLSGTVSTPGALRGTSVGEKPYPFLPFKVNI
jgi:hypothetical protein